MCMIYVDIATGTVPVNFLKICVIKTNIGICKKKEGDKEEEREEASVNTKFNK